MFKGIPITHTLRYSLVLLTTILFNLTGINKCYSQFGTIYGYIKDGSDNSPISGVFISKDTARTLDSSLADGRYVCRLIDGPHTIYFKYPGYQTKVLRQVIIDKNQMLKLDIILYPIASGFEKNNQKIIADSAGSKEILLTTTFEAESQSAIYNSLFDANTLSSHIGHEQISPGTDKNTALLLNRLHGVIVSNSPVRRNNQQLFMNGLGPRYNQVLFNGTVMNSMDYWNRTFPLEILPVEAIESVSLHTASSSFLPADFAGGSVNIITSDLPKNDFFTLQIGGGFYTETRGELFYGDKRNSTQFTSFPGNIRNLPSGFPSSRSQSLLHEKNLQEQFDLVKLLSNNLGPVEYGKSSFDYRILAGYGKKLRYKNGLVFGIEAYVNHSKEELIEQSITQVSPDIVNNPFPFDPTKKLIRSQSQDNNFTTLAQLAGTLNLSFQFRKNKISVRNYLGNQFSNILTLRNNISKPDEDTLASNGIRYFTEQKQFWYTQVAGIHALGEKGKFQIDWQATYNYQSQDNPDERNFLLRKSSVSENEYEIATPQSPELDRTSIDPGQVNPAVEFSQLSNFTNTSRLWRSYLENNFNAFLNLRAPINIAKHPQIIQGGFYLQNVNRRFLSDLMLVKGTGFTTLDNLLSADKYYPGGLTVTNYYSNIDRISGKAPNYINRGNYSSNQNIGASYVNFENRLFKSFFIKWGLRLESSNLTSTIVQYEYVPGYRYPQKFSIDDNLNQVKFTLLPSFNAAYNLLKKIQFNANYSKTVNRPLFQEVNNNYYYDASSFLVQSGNPSLQSSLIDNYSLGATWLPDAHSFLKVQAFYKFIDAPIEYLVSQYSTGNMFVKPYNLPSANIKGLQANLNWSFKSITSNKWASAITLFASGVLLQSEVDEGPVRSQTIGIIRSHNLSETPDYSFSAGLIIQHAHLPELLVTYNQISDYISKLGTGQSVLLSNGEMINAIPDYRIKGQRQLNIQAGQKLLKSKLQIIAGVTNFLKDSFIEYQDLNGNEKFDEPITVTDGVNGNGFYKSGIDNAVTNFKTQANFYFRVSWSF